MSATTPSPASGPIGVSRVDLLVAAARERIDRVTAHQARLELAAGGAVLVDTRPVSQRAEHGEIEGALVIDRNVLEWRFDPTNQACLPVADLDLRVIVLCQEGYSSSLAVAARRDVGVLRATDVIGGQSAWLASGLPLSVD